MPYPRAYNTVCDSGGIQSLAQVASKAAHVSTTCARYLQPTRSQRCCGIDEGRFPTGRDFFLTKIAVHQVDAFRGIGQNHGGGQGSMADDVGGDAD